MSEFEFLTIKIMAAHEIFKRNSNKEIVKPSEGKALIPLDAESIATLQERLVGAITSDTHCIEMTIDKDNQSTTAAHVKELVVKDEKEFPKKSYELAKNLAHAQQSRKIPGGALIILRGITGSEQNPFVAIIKAEMQEGFRKRTKDGSITITHVKDLLLTPQQRLYKIGLFIKTGLKQDEYKVFVYDQTMTANETQSAAAYFYNNFLGCYFSPTDKKLTSDFYTYTNEFIASLDIDEENKLDLKTSLYTYLKTSNSTKIKVSDFANQYFKSEHRGLYESFMDGKKFPKIAVGKDLAYLKTKLKRRKMRFNSDVKIDAPQQNFSDLVIIDGVENGYTKLSIKGAICGQ